MKIVKPLRLGLLSRPYRMRGRQRLGLAVFALATLDEQALLQPEADLWSLAGEALGEDGVLDLAVPKPCAEFLVSGAAYTAHQQDRTACMARVRVGELEKTLAVFGERYWLDGKPTPPAPFEAMPLDWAHAFGGPEYADNPHGRGAGDERIAGVRTRRLPNVEPARGRMQRPDQRPEPAGFGPVSPLWPRRFARAGQYHESWLDDGFPGFLDTLDPHFFNAAAPDQWWPGQPELAAGAPYALWNLHPRLACQQGALPRWRARCLLRRAGETALEDVALRLTTAWFFPDRERLLLIYHGATDIAQDDGADIELAMPALDAADAPRPLAHYEAVLAQRLDAQDGALHALRDKDLLPAQALGPWDALQAANPMEQPFAVNQRARGAAIRAQLGEQARAHGVDPRAYEPPPAPMPAAPQLDDLPDIARHMRQAAQEARIDALHARRRMAEALQARGAELPPAMGAAALAAAADGAGRGGPPSLHNHPALATLQELARAQPLGSGADRLDAGSVGARLREAQQQLGRLYLHAAHHQPPAEAARPARAARLRRRVQALMAGSRDLAGLDLTGADLSGLDLRGARCVGTWMEGADLSGALLDDANLSQAVLARAHAEGGSWRRAVLAGANLGQAALDGVDLAGARLSSPVLDGIVLVDCALSASRWNDCHLAGARLERCRFDQAELDTVTFWQGTLLRETGFAAARLARVTWLDCELDGLDFAGARLRRCAWVQSQCGAAPNWAGAELQTCCVVETDMPHAVFAGATLRECSLRDTVLDHADFTGAALWRCDLSQASLGGASLARARAPDSLFIRADLGGASLAEADLPGALLQKATLTHADLRGANLFRADLGLAVLDDTSDTRGAYTHLANTRPRARHGR